jgi:uncharacterized protein YjbI with pentapeptide repeats
MDELSNQLAQPPEPRVGEDGSPIYDQEFFLALARCGKDVWNEWRREHEDRQPYIAVTFANVDFREPKNSTIDFSGFNFGNLAKFSDATFESGAHFSGSTFGRGADFSRAAFVVDLARLSAETLLLEVADFAGATFLAEADPTFEDSANFSGAAFVGAHFTGATFRAGADFTGAVFGDRADFLGATFFGCAAMFSEIHVVGVADFSGATFAWRADFSGATFAGDAYFRGWSPDERKAFRINLAEGRLSSVWDEIRKARRGLHEESPSERFFVRFAGVRFIGGVDFSGREFGRTADFSLARFGEPPRFDSLTNVDLYNAKISFTGKIPGWTTRSEVAVQLRYLRKLADDVKNHDLERDLYIEERKAERGINLAALLRDGWHYIRHPRRRDGTNFYGTSIIYFLLFLCLQLVLPLPKLLIQLTWIAAMFFYWLLADYGRSFIRPFSALLLSVVLFHTAYWLALRPQVALGFWPRITWALHQTITWPQANDEPFVRATRAFALANAVPFVGALTLDKEIKERLICGDQPVDEKKAAQLGVQPCIPIPPLRFQALALLQTIVSALCVFFIALALRNYFRMR